MILPNPQTQGEAEISCGMVRLDKATHQGGWGGQACGLQGGVKGVFRDRCLGE